MAWTKSGMLSCWQFPGSAMDVLESSRFDVASRTGYSTIGALFVDYWKVILSALLAGAVIAVVLSLLLALVVPRYEAQSHLVLVGGKYQLNLDPNFKTVDPIGSTGSTGSTAVPIVSRADEFRAIVLSPTVEEAALERLRTAAPVKWGERSTLESVTVQSRNALISIRASADEPVEAAQVANAYAEAAAARLNHVYGQTSADRAVLTRQAEEAQSALERAEAAYRTYIAENRVDALNLEIDQKEAYRGQLANLLKQEDALVTGALAHYYVTLSALDRLSRDTEMLRQQVASAGQSTAGLVSYANSLLSLQARLMELDFRPADEQYTPANDEAGPLRIHTTPPPPFQLQINAETLATVDRAQLSGDIKALEEAIASRRSIVLTDIEGAAQDLAGIGSGQGAPSAPAVARQRILEDIDHIIPQIQQLRAELQQETARGELLKRDVELATTAINTLGSKVQEAEIAAATSGEIATVTTPAAPPKERLFPPSPARAALFGAVVGLILGCLGALGLATRRVNLQRSERPSTAPQVVNPVGAAP